MLTCHLNILAHRSDTKLTRKHLTQQNHLELALNQTQKEEIHLNFKDSLTQTSFLVLEKLLVPVGIPNSVDQTGNGLEEHVDATSPDLTAQQLQPC